MDVYGMELPRQIYNYTAPWPLYSMNWSTRPDHRLRLAIGSFLMSERKNKVQIVSLDNEESEISLKSTFDHPFPPTKIMWIPDNNGVHPDLLATSGDYLRIWKAGEPETNLERFLVGHCRNSEYTLPLSSFDWNEVDPNLIGGASIDGTCTIWNVETNQTIRSINPSIRAQVIAHNQAFDIAFCRAGSGRDMFASAGADGSIKMFDLRRLEYSTMIYEDPENQPMARLAWNKEDPHYLATFALDDTEVTILDIRYPGVPFIRLNHDFINLTCINGISWNPYSEYNICTAGNDQKAFIWDIDQLPGTIIDPILSYTTPGGAVTQVQWGPSDFIAIVYGSSLEMLRV